jgi:hypothetical protein
LVKQCEICGSTEGEIFGKKGKFGMDLCRKHYSQMWQYGKILDRTKFESNEFIVSDDTLEIVMYDVNHLEVGRTLVSIRHYSIVITYKWYLSSNSYVMTRKGNKLVSLHRLITKATKDEVVDHINHNKLDNRDENLRKCTQSENMRNQGVRTNNTSGVTGVTWDKSRSKWEAYVRINGKTIHLGRFSSKEDAVAARKKAEEEYFGEFRYQEAN